MTTRRDQFQSYQFTVQRVVSALVLRETDPVQSPLRRMGGAAFGSVMLAVLAVGVVGVIGVLFPGGNERWKAGDAVIVEKQTGSNFVWMPDSRGDFYLYPVVNFSSAALLANTTTTVAVSRNSLVGVPRGPQLGIPDAPDALPDPRRMLGAPWTLCSLPAQTVSGEEIPNTLLVVGPPSAKGVSIRSRAVLVRDTERGSLHLVWKGHRYRIASEDPVLDGLSLRLTPKIRVGTAWLSALPAGRELGPRRLDGEGGKSAALPGARIGEIRVVESGNNRQYYLVDRQALIAITQMQADMQLADRETSRLAYGGRRPLPLELSAADPARRVDLASTHDSDPPAKRPMMADVSSERSTVCASFDDAGPIPEVAVEAAVPGAAVAPATRRRTGDGTVLADRIQVKPGWGTIVESMVSSTSPSGSLHLVTDQGKRFAIPTNSVKAALGYRHVVPVQMPASLVARIPAGDALDPAAAKAAY